MSTRSAHAASVRAAPPAANAPQEVVPATTARALTIATPFGPYELPRLKVDSLHSIAAASARPATSVQRQILIVDEDPISCARVAALLRECGHRVLAADSPNAADQLRATVACDLCIAKLGDHPAALLAWLQRFAREDATPILTIGRHAQPGPTLASVALGATAHLTTPFQLRSLTSLVAQLLPR